MPPLSPDRPHLSPGLYVVATPIGNLEDLSPRARRVLGTARVIAAEDTRVSGLLVRLAEGKGRLLSLTEYNVDERAPELLEAARDGPVALVSDAGTPLVSDPGGRLVEAAHAAGVAVVPVPGPSALVAALSASGFDGSDVRFLGFLPRPPGERRSVVTAAAGAKTLVFFESPSRLPRTLSELADWLGDPEVCVCRELTKAHEDVRRGRASGLAPRFANTRGECTVVVRCPETEGETDEDAAREYMAEMQRAGARRSAAAAEASRRFGIGRERAYTFWSGGVDQDGG